MDSAGDEQRFSEAGRREPNCPEMYGGTGDISRSYGRRCKTDGVNNRGGGVRREIVWLPSLDAFRTFAAICPPGVFAASAANPMSAGGLR